MLPNVHVLGLTLPSAPLTLLLGGYLALWIAAREFGRRRLSPDLAYDAAFYALLAGAATARLWYVGRNLRAYQTAPLQALSLSTGTLDLLPGVTAGVAAALWLIWRRGALQARTGDAFAPALAVFAATVSLASFLSGTAYGQPAALPWAIELWGAERHPTQLYQLGFDLLTLAAVWRWRRSLRPGSLFLLALMLLATSRLVVEGFRADSVLLSGGFRRDQFLYLAAGLASLYALARRPHRA